LSAFLYSGAAFVMTATEAALYDQQVNGGLNAWMGKLTHKNLPLALFLETSDLGYPAWSGSTTQKASNSDILSSLGIGIVRFTDEITPVEINDYDYEYRVDTDVISSVEVSGGQSDRTIQRPCSSSLRAHPILYQMFSTQRETVSLYGLSGIRRMNPAL
jgi:hypothetical protein